MFPKVIGVDLIAKEAKYHHSCKSTLILAAGRAAKPQQSAADISIDSSKDFCALSQIYGYVKQFVIINKRPELLTSVYERYVDMCIDTSETPRNTVFSPSRALTSKFQFHIKIQTPPSKKLGRIICSADISASEVRKVYDYALTDEKIVTKAALLMCRNSCLVLRKLTFLKVSH